MKNIIYVILIAALVCLCFFCGDSNKNKKGTSYTQELIGALGKADTLELDTKIKAIKDALDSYYTDNNQYPDSLETLVPEYLRTENDLVDPWGTRFKLEMDSAMSLTLVSAGKDKMFNNADDIKRRI